MTEKLCVARIKIIWAIILSCLCISTANAVDERIWLDVKINDQPVRLHLDTGCDFPIILYSRPAQRLGLKLMPFDSRPPKLYGTVLEMTEPLALEWNGIKESASIPVLPDSNYPEDGVLGWPFVRQHFNQRPLLLDTATGKLTWLTNLPAGLETWSKFQIETNLGVLAFQISLQKDKACVVVFDTGTPCGVKLGPEKFEEWALNHTHRTTTTYEAYTTMDNHLVIAEQAWAKEVSLGSVEITEVPVEGADPNDVASGTSTNTQFAAILGLAALKRLDVIIDNQNNVIYLRLKKTPLLPYQHNRLGAIFAPQDSKGTNFIARVTAGSPAYEAGIRNGDILLNRDANGTFEQPAGTKINFTLKRDDKIFTTTAVLRNILPPDSTKN